MIPILGPWLESRRGHTRIIDLAVGRGYGRSPFPRHSHVLPPVTSDRGHSNAMSPPAMVRRAGAG
jgi:hypothetical protein